MALGASARAQGLAADVGAVVAGDVSTATGVPHGSELARLATAALRRSEDLDDARERLADAVGRAGVGDAAAMTGFFDGINRVADATGLAVPEPWSTMADGMLPAEELRRLRGPATAPS